MADLEVVGVNRWGIIHHPIGAHRTAEELIAQLSAVMTPERAAETTWSVKEQRRHDRQQPVSPSSDVPVRVGEPHLRRDP